MAQEEEAKLKLRGQEEPGEVTRHLGFAEQVLALKVVYMDSVLRNSMAEVWLRCALCSSSNLVSSPSEQGGVVN